MIDLATPVTNLRMVGSTYGNRLKKLEITSVGDLLYHVPSRYDDRSLISKINFLQNGEKVTVIGGIVSSKNVYTKSGKVMQQVRLADDTGEIDIIWYNQPYLINVLKKGTRITLFGLVSWYLHSLVIISPEYEMLRFDNRMVHTGRLVPIYPETEGVSSKWLRSRIDTIFHILKPVIPEILPPEILAEYNLLPREQAIYQIHYPKSLEEAEASRHRLSFDEIITLQLAAIERKRELQKKSVSARLSIKKFQPKIDKFINSLPFQLTPAQQKSVAEILRDLESFTPMNRLLEGDVGSGKTVVAIISGYATYLNKYQTLFMAPTDILARQHYQTADKLLTPLGIRVALVTGNKKHEAFPEADFLIGTHALLHVKLVSRKIGLVIIDEQQRFGVTQRAILREKAGNPHVLTMTATPIPRTIALTLYADLDLSVIDEMPQGRIRVKTWAVPPEKRARAYEWIRSQVKNETVRQQAFIICPLIDESENLESVKAATNEYQRLQTDVFPDLKLALLHGRMKPTEKQKLLSQFRDGKYDILIATPVVEVGIDIPAAIIMMIESAQRFGLAQLHQLRGRVGRAQLQSYCLLFSDTDDPQTMTRLRSLEKVYSGPKLAELDLSLRGSGDIFGTRQHGLMGLKIADPTDLPLITMARRAAENILNTDPALSNFPLLRSLVERYTINSIAPD